MALTAIYASIGAPMLAGTLVTVIGLVYALKKGAVAGPNPFGASTLEWTTQSPPLTENFTEVPIVTSEPYEYEHVVAKEKHLV